MRLTLLAVIFFLALTLGNAWLLQNTREVVTAHDYAIVQITQPHAKHYEWDAFIAREVVIVVATVVIFGVIAGTERRQRLRTAAHQQFASFIANRRR